MSEAAASKKPAWQRPENWMAWGGIAIAGYVALMGLDKILPLVNRVLELALTSVWYGVGLAGSLGLVTWLITSKDLHRIVWHLYKMGMRKLLGAVVELDPIAILKLHVGRLKENLETISKSLAELRGQARSLRDKIEETAQKHAQSMNMMAQAQARAKDGQQNMKREFALQARKAGRLESSSVTYQGLLNRLNAHVAVTEKIKESAEFMVADIEDTVEVETEKRKMIRSNHKAMSANKRILEGGQQREMYDMAMESIANDYNSKLGEIEQFMSDSQHFINTMDLENGVYEADALAKLEAWDKRSAELLEGGSGKTKYRVSPAETPDFAAQDEEIDQKLDRQSYADLFDKI